MANPTKRIPPPDTLLVLCECANDGCRRKMIVPMAAFIALSPNHYACHPECPANPGDVLVERCDGYVVWREDEHVSEG